MKKTILVLAMVVLVTGNLQADLFDGLVAFWPLDENADNTFVSDISSNGHNGTAQDNTSALHVVGKIGGALDFNGTSDAVMIGDANELSFGDDYNDSAFTIAVWIKVDFVGSEQVVLSKYNATSNISYREWRFSLNATNNLFFRVTDESAGAFHTLTANEALSTDNWHFVVVSYDGLGGVNAANGMTLYVDGSAVAATSSSHQIYTAMEDLNTDVIIGAWTGWDGNLGNFFDGRIDNLWIFGRELQQTEIVELYQCQFFADAGSNQTIADTDYNGSEEVTLDGSGSYDPDGTIVSWVWTDDLGDVIPDGEITTAILSVGTHTITLTVTDNEGQTETDNVTIAVTVPPIADAGADVVADANEEVILDASASTDPDGNIVQYTWTALPENIVLYSGEESTFTTRAFGRVEETIKLTVTDNQGAASEDTISIFNKQMLTQISTLQQANVALLLQVQALEQQSALLQKTMDDNRYLLEQLPQLQKKMDELEAAVEESP